MDNIKISLAIFGNQNSNSGFQPLYWINDPPQQLENIVPPGMDENPFFFTLQVLPTHTQYTLIHNRVSSYMSVRSGVLKMAITLPKGYCIGNGVSPMQVLLEVRQKFIDTCMTLRDAHAEAYNFKEKLANPDEFSSIVDAYQLVPCTQPQLPMTGTEDAVILLDDNAIAQLFIAPHYPEFTPYRRIVVANKGNASVYKMQFNGVVATDTKVLEEAPKTEDSQDTISDTVTIPVQKTEKSSVVFSKNSLDFSKSHSSILNKRNIIIALCALLLIGGATFLLWPSSCHKTSKHDITEESEPITAEESEDEELSAEEKQLLKDIKANQRLLSDSMLTFNDIIILTAWANEPVNRDNISSSTLVKFDDLRQQIMVYDTLRNMCVKQEYNGTWKYTKEQKVLFSTTLDSLYSTGYLNEIHYHYLRAAYMVPKPCFDEPGCLNGIGWGNDNPDKLDVFKSFLYKRDKKGQYNSFKKIYDEALGRQTQPVAEQAETTAAPGARPSNHQIVIDEKSNHVISSENSNANPSSFDDR